ncbi:RNA polymerase sigma factor [Actinomadura gamaensis]|uniref:RNA polymerase sigma factor n=1 Tax=Actinomadura gamaensis TaxID=1763541 RepID=A0ABV9U6Y8_9ACTN
MPIGPPHDDRTENGGAATGSGADSGTRAGASAGTGAGTGAEIGSDEVRIEDVFREEHGRLLAALARRFGDLDLAEEAAADALEAAVARWPVDGVPPNPGGWLMTTARRRAVDRLRRDRALAVRLAILRVEADRAEPPPDPSEAADAADAAGGEAGLPDERLLLFFTCAHPALSAADRVALTLRFLGGLSTPEVARAFLVPVETMAKRLTRAKRKIVQARIPFRVPGADELPERLPAVLQAVYSIFTEGYAASSGPRLQRTDLAEEAIRLGRILHHLLPTSPRPTPTPTPTPSATSAPASAPTTTTNGHANGKEERETAGLLALMLLVHARRATRLGPDGGLALLDDQDRARWDRDMIEEGRALTVTALTGGPPGPYGVQAAIAALHAEAPDVAGTDWPQIVALYDVLLALAPSPVVALNRAVAVAMRDGPEAGLVLLDDLRDEPGLRAYHPYLVARADLLERTGRLPEAGAAYRAALELAGTEPERVRLRRRVAGIEARLNES